MEEIKIEAERIITPYKAPSKAYRYFTAVLALIGFACVGAVVYVAVTGADFGRQRPKTYSEIFAPLYKTYGIEPLPEALVDVPVYSALARLAKQPCNWEAMTALGQNLKDKKESWLAANAYLGFSKSCQSDGSAERAAADLFLSTKDFRKAQGLYADLTNRFPYADLDWYHKGQAEHALGMTNEALDSFSNTIALAREPAKLGDWVFTEMSEIYASAGRLCDAMMPISTYISLDPDTHDNPRMQEMLRGFSQKGNCKSYATGSDSFPVPDSGVIIVKASVNGTEGTFAVDTGASYVAVSPEFASRAGLSASGVRRMMTANGEADAKPAIAAIKLGKLQASDVPIVVLEKSLGKTDGLLGRSFLSRFEMNVTKTRLTLKTK